MFIYKSNYSIFKVLFVYQLKILSAHSTRSLRKPPLERTRWKWLLRPNWRMLQITLSQFSCVVQHSGFACLFSIFGWKKNWREKMEIAWKHLAPTMSPASIVSMQKGERNSSNRWQSGRMTNLRVESTTNDTIWPECNRLEKLEMSSRDSFGCHSNGLSSRQRWKNLFLVSFLPNGISSMIHVLTIA